jgi:hypothetical protein
MGVGMLQGWCNLKGLSLVVENISSKRLKIIGSNPIALIGGGASIQLR